MVGTIEALKEDLERYENLMEEAQEACDKLPRLRAIVDNLRQVIESATGESLNPSDVKLGEFQGLGLLDALVRYLERRGGAAKLRDEVIPALVAGGALTSKDRKPLCDVRPNARYRILVNLIDLHGRGRATYQRETDIVKLPN